MRLIDADALREILDKIPARSIENADGQTYVLIRLSTVFEVTKQMPTIESRKMGKWIYYDPNGFKCSRCGSYLEISCGDVKMNFCPNCGADMREGDSE